MVVLQYCYKLRNINSFNFDNDTSQGVPEGDVNCHVYNFVDTKLFYRYYNILKLKLLSIQACIIYAFELISQVNQGKNRMISFNP